MTIAKQVAKHLRDAHFGGNWNTVDLKHTLEDISWNEANTQIYSLNSIAAISSHLAYYVNVLITVLEENKLEGKDELSWISPTMQSQEEWKKFQEEMWVKVERAALLVEKLPDELLIRDFVDPKYGTNYRNIVGMIEHIHYHLGQIVLIKKLLTQ